MEKFSCKLDMSTIYPTFDWIWKTLILSLIDSLSKLWLKISIFITAWTSPQARLWSKSKNFGHNFNRSPPCLAYDQIWRSLVTSWIGHLPLVWDLTYLLLIAWYTVAPCSLRLKLDRFYCNMSISSCIQSQDLNLIASFSFTNKVVEIQHVCPIVFEEKKGGKRMWNLYKRCYSHPLTSLSSWMC
jgi:hypothetical protein